MSHAEADTGFRKGGVGWGWWGGGGGGVRLTVNLTKTHHIRGHALNVFPSF